MIGISYIPRDSVQYLTNIEELVNIMNEYLRACYGEYAHRWDLESFRTIYLENPNIIYFVIAKLFNRVVGFASIDGRRVSFGGIAELRGPFINPLLPLSLIEEITDLIIGRALYLARALSAQQLEAYTLSEGFLNSTKRIALLRNHFIEIEQGYEMTLQCSERFCSEEIKMPSNSMLIDYKFEDQELRKALLLTVNESFAKHPGFTPITEEFLRMRERIKSWRESTKKLLFLDKEVVGAIIYGVPSKLYGYINSIGIRPKHQGKGFGKLLMRIAVKNLCCLRGVKEVRLWVHASNEKALRLYSKMGFVIDDITHIYRAST